MIRPQYYGNNKIIMGRLERYRNFRRYKKKIIALVIFNLIILVAGICAVDYSVNSLMLENKRINIISFNNTESSLEICFLNNTFSIPQNNFIKFSP
jgi:hypothetical protein